MKKRFHGFLFSGVLVAVFALSVTTAQAAQWKMNSIAITQMTMMGLGPLPGASLMGPMEMDRFGELVTEYAWPMPEKRAWPIDITGQPIVDTRRKDEMWHTVNSWQTVRRLRTMYRRTNAQLRELNPDIDLFDLQEGQEVLIWRRDDEKISESRGEPQSGRLIYGEPIPKSDNYIVLFPWRAFGTYYAVSEVVRMLDGYYNAFADADPLMIGDFGFRTGRSISPHNSHQSGRDVDITLPRYDRPPNYNRFHHVRRDNLDAERALWLLTKLLEGGYVQYVFLDWHHQRTIRNLAQEQGAPDEWLEEVFQYPRRGGPGIVRHAPGHAGHFHIRFHCQKTDRWCG